MLFPEQNIYKYARLTAREKYTTDEAAFALHIGESSLRAYEAGQRPVPDDVAADMVILYDNLGLAQAHLKNKGRVAEMVLPDIDDKSLIQTSVELFTLMQEFQRKDSLHRLLALAADDVLEESERPEFDEIVDQMRNIIKKGLGLQRFCSAREEFGGR